MSRALQLIAIVLSIVLIIFAFVYIDTIRYYRIASWASLLNTDSSTYSSYTDSSSYNEYRDQMKSATSFAALISAVLLLYFTATHIIAMVQVKTKTSLVFSIIGIVFSALALVPAVLMIVDPGKMTFDEGGYVMILYGILALAFSIVGTVQAFRFAARKARMAAWPQQQMPYPQQQPMQQQNPWPQQNPYPPQNPIPPQNGGNQPPPNWPNA